MTHILGGYGVALLAGKVFRVTSKPTYYLTTAIAYPNGVPHLGHAYEYIAADVMARFKRLDGFDVRFLTGTDEHGQKVMQAAERAGVPTQEYVDDLVKQFIDLDAALGITYDRFIRTTDQDHYASAQELWRRMEVNGDIYLDKYEGWYSVRDEAYWTQEETELGEDGVRRATETGTEVEWTEEESYFFRLSHYQDKLLALYQQQGEFAAPSYRFNEVISFVTQGLNDLSISRTSFDWGVPVPGDPKHVMYVWVDALSNYLTGVGFPDWDGEGAQLQRFWPADLHVIGKDISRFHAIFWPAFLMSAGLELPQRIIIHGFLMNNGAKLSKSTGNSVDPIELIEKYGLDQLRYFLLREVPFGQDGSYSHDAIVGRMNADLANNFGNLAQRSLSMVAKNLDGVVAEPGEFTPEDRAILDAAHNLIDPVRERMDHQEFSRALEAIWAVLGDANAYFAAQAPWVLRKTDPDRMATVLYVTLEVLRVAAILTQAFMPASTAKLLDLLGQPEGAAREVASIGVVLQPGTQLPAPEPVFPKFED